MHGVVWKAILKKLPSSLELLDCKLSGEKLKIPSALSFHSTYPGHSIMNVAPAFLQQLSLNLSVTLKVCGPSPFSAVAILHLSYHRYGLLAMDGDGSRDDWAWGRENRGLAWSSQELSTEPTLRIPSNNQIPLALKPPNSPQWSITTLRSLDISSNTSRIAAAVMDAEDSPWGGLS